MGGPTRGLRANLGGVTHVSADETIMSIPPRPPPRLRPNLPPLGDLTTGDMETAMKIFREETLKVAGMWKEQ